MEHQKPYIELKVKMDFKFTPQSAADFLDIDIQILRRNLRREKTEKHYIKSYQHAPNGTITIYAYDLEDYMKRIEIGTDYRGTAKK